MSAQNVLWWSLIWVKVSVISSQCQQNFFSSISADHLDLHFSIILDIFQTSHKLDCCGNYDKIIRQCDVTWKQNSRLKTDQYFIANTLFAFNSFESGNIIWADNEADTDKSRYKPFVNFFFFDWIAMKQRLSF